MRIITLGYNLCQHPAKSDLEMEQTSQALIQQMDAKLDHLMASMARLDERINAGTGRVDRLEYRLDQIEERVNTLDLAFAKSLGKGLIAERAAWIVFSAAIAAMARWL